RCRRPIRDGRMTLTVADLLRSNVRELDRRAKTIDRFGWASLACAPDCWVLAIEIGRVYRFTGPDPSPLFDQANSLIKEHDPDAVVAMLGIEAAIHAE